MLENAEKQFKQKFDYYDKQLEYIDNKFQGIKKSFNELKEIIETMKHSIILIENKVNTDLPALFEVYSLNYDLQKENVQRTNSLEIKSNNHSDRIDILENTVEDHSKKIEKLIS